MRVVETDWRSVPALSSREEGFAVSPVSFSGAGVGMMGGGRVGGEGLE